MTWDKSINWVNVYNGKSGDGSWNSEGWRWTSWNEKKKDEELDTKKE